MNRTLEQKLQGKLDLSRRAEISCREARRLDCTERSASRCEHRIAEVRMVEDIEHLASELEIEFLTDLCIFCDREIRIKEVGSSDGITAEVAGMANHPNTR